MGHDAEVSTLPVPTGIRFFDAAGAAERLRIGPIEVAGWNGALALPGLGTTFLVASRPATLRTGVGTYPLPASAHAVVTEPAEVAGGCGVAVTMSTHRGLFVVGGAAESVGRLRYIDGCSDTVLVAPIRRGDPCLNLLHLPPRVVQTDHHHPSPRVGIVVAGCGTCVSPGLGRSPLRVGTVFVLTEGTVHRFETASVPLTIVAFHPDSDSGPTDVDHPMLNRTLRPDTSDRVR